MTLEEKIEIFENFLDSFITRCSQQKTMSSDKYNDYIDRMISLQNLILSLRRRKQRIDDRWIIRGDYE